MIAVSGLAHYEPQHRDGETHFLFYHFLLESKRKDTIAKLQRGFVSRATVLA